MMTTSSEDLLQFKDYTGDNVGVHSPPPAQISVNSPTHSTDRVQRSDFVYDVTSANTTASGEANIMGGAFAGSGSKGADEMSTKTVSFLSIEYYQQFFNVDTYLVLERIVNSMIPKRAAGNYLKSGIGSNPDLYGPFWITVTLIFSIAISGNIASYLQHADDNYQWHYNFRLVSYAASCIFLYACGFPMALWALFKYSLKPIDEELETENAHYKPSLLSLMCIYGYSLSVYIPVSILWVIQISLVQWLLVVTAAFLSGSVLIIVLTPALRNSKISLFIIIGILGAHFLLAAGFMLFFFQTHGSTVTPPLASSNIVKHSIEKIVNATV